MENKYKTLYRMSYDEASRLKCVKDWRESLNENIKCRQAIEEMLREKWDGARLEKGCEQEIIETFGFHRVNYVLAKTLQAKDYDGRFSRGNLEWGKSTWIPNSLDKSTGEDMNIRFLVDSHPCKVEIFITRVRDAFKKLEMFDRSHCLPCTDKQAFEGRMLVMNPELLQADNLNPKEQIWLATGGFGCAVNSRGRAVFATNVATGEHDRFYRNDFLGVIAEGNVPEWANEGFKMLSEQKESIKMTDI